MLKPENAELRDEIARLQGLEGRNQASDAGVLRAREAERTSGVGRPIAS